MSKSPFIPCKVLSFSRGLTSDTGGSERGVRGLKYRPDYRHLSPPIYAYASDDNFPVEFLEIAKDRKGNFYGSATLFSVSDYSMYRDDMGKLTDRIKASACFETGLIDTLPIPRHAVYLVTDQDTFEELDASIGSRAQLPEWTTLIDWHPRGYYSVDADDVFLALVAQMVACKDPSDFLSNLMNYSNSVRHGRRRFDVGAFYDDLESRLKINLDRTDVPRIVRY